jgi:hypothetical protein
MTCETSFLAIDPFPALLLPTCAQCAGIGLHGIPAMLWDMEDACGEAALFAFLLAYGGRRYKAPAKEPQARSDDPLSIARNWFHNQFGSGAIDIPLGPAAQRARFAWTVFDRLQRGHTVQKVASDLRVSERTILFQKARLRRIGALSSNTSGQRSDQ